MFVWWGWGGLLWNVRREGKRVKDRWSLSGVVPFSLFRSHSLLAGFTLLLTTIQSVTSCPPPPFSLSLSLSLSLAIHHYPSLSAAPPHLFSCCHENPPITPAILSVSFPSPVSPRPCSGWRWLSTEAVKPIAFCSLCNKSKRRPLGPKKRTKIVRTRKKTLFTYHSEVINTTTTAAYLMFCILCVLPFYPDNTFIFSFSGLLSSHLLNILRAKVPLYIVVAICFKCTGSPKSWSE